MKRTFVLFLLLVALTSIPVAGTAGPRTTPPSRQASFVEQVVNWIRLLLPGPGKPGRGLIKPECGPNADPSGICG